MINEEKIANIDNDIIRMIEAAYTEGALDKYTYGIDFGDLTIAEKRFLQVLLIYREAIYHDKPI